MKYVRWLGAALLILIMGYLSAFGLFADSSLAGLFGLTLLFVAGSAAVGALLPRYWPLALLCSWGAVLMTILELGFRLGREPVAGQQPALQVLLTGLGAAGLAGLGGYLGYRLRRRNG